MKILLRLLSPLFLIAIFASNAWAAKPKILLLKDLQPGTNAIGFSVFKGVEPLPFDVVLGGVTDYMGNSLILSRVSGGPMETQLEEIGAISGMSGSPVFIDCINKKLSDDEQLQNCILNGTLVGSTSYGPGHFIKGGTNFLLTPAEFMLGARTGGYSVVSSFSNRLSDKISIAGEEFINLMLFPKMEDLQVGGNSNDRCKESVKSDIKPGSMVSVFLATGTYNFPASGTVTWRDDDKIYIFGHPFMGSGMVSYPFVQVSVADTIQTPFNAYKITGCHLDTKGAMLVDGAFEMAGIIGRTASMLPYQVELRIGHGSMILNEEIAASPYMPAIIQGLPVLWAQQFFGNLNQTSLAYQFRISLAEQPEIFVRNMVPASVDKNPLEEVFAKVYNPIKKLKESGFGHKIEEVKVRLDFLRNFELWTAKKAFLSQQGASPGETVFVNVILEGYFSSDTKQISIPIKVPEDFMERIGPTNQPNISVLIQSGNKYTDKKESVKRASVEDLIKELNQSMNYRNNLLYVQQVMPKNKAEQEADKANAKAFTKTPWKWTDIGDDDLRQTPSGYKDEVVLTLSPVLNHFINLDLIFNIRVEPKKDETRKDKKEAKHKKWFLF